MFDRIFRNLLIIISAGFILTACHKKNRDKETIIRPVKSVVVTSARTTSKRIFPGTVLAGKMTKLSFEVTGRLLKLPINEGDEVKKNQLIAQINPKKYQERVSETRAKYLENLAQFKRGKKLVKDKFISQARFDAIKANYKVAQANYTTAQHDLNDTYLKAPFSGVIAKKYVDNFEFVKAKQVIADLHNTKTVDIEIDVPENIMINLSKEDSAHNKAHHIVAIFNARPNLSFPLSFKEVTTTADPNTQTYRVVFTMPRPNNLNVLPGMNVNVNIAIPEFNEKSSQFYLLPTSTVFTDNDQKPMVWIIDKDMRVKKIPVTITRLTKDKIKVISGIQAGDRVVVSGVHYLKPGQKVKLLKHQEKNE